MPDVKKAKEGGEGKGKEKNDDPSTANGQEEGNNNSNDNGQEEGNNNSTSDNKEETHNAFRFNEAKSMTTPTPTTTKEPQIGMGR
jgi:hypothetical protein